MLAPPRILFVTGKLAESALRRQLQDLAPKVGFHFDVAVMPITVAALLTAPWVAKRLTIPVETTRVVVPGFLAGDLKPIQELTAAPVERGPKDLRDLPEYFGKKSGPPEGYGQYDIEILAEINHVPRKSFDEILRIARHYRDSGADRIDLGLDPGQTWAGVRDCVQMLLGEGFKVSVDSFNNDEVEAALGAGANLVLSVNSTNLLNAKRWNEQFPGIEVVAIPDTPTDLDSLARTREELHRAGVRHRLDPILEPIGFGFAASLGRYLEARQRFPDAEMMMGVGNLTELTDADSSGVNVILAGFCQELGIRSVLATEVINWGRSAVREFDLARQLVYFARKERVLPKRLEPRLLLLRDPRLHEFGEVALLELAERITDRNYRLFAERGELHVMNGSYYLRGTDPFALFTKMIQNDPKLDASHAFYLGYEFAKAITALTLGKNYEQDRALNWGFLTIPETSHQNRTDG